MTDFTRLEHKFATQQQWLYYGAITSFFHGSWLSLADFTRYIPGDASNHINRKLSAKHNELWVNQWYEDKDMLIDIFLDINANWSGGMYETHRSLVQQWLADYMLFTHTHHLSSTTVYTYGESMRMALPCSTASVWMQWYAYRDTQVNESRKIDAWYSHLPTFLEEQITKKKKRMIIIFSDFLWCSHEHVQMLNWLDERYAVTQIVLDVPTLELSLV